MVVGIVGGLLRKTWGKETCPWDGSSSSNRARWRTLSTASCTWQMGRNEWV